MGLLLGECAHEISVLESVDGLAVDAGIVDGGGSGFRKEVPPGTVAVIAKRGETDTRNANCGHGYRLNRME
jgi:hypothetical protein